jgi:hypothetical protein
LISAPWASAAGDVGAVGDERAAMVSPRMRGQRVMSVSRLGRPEPRGQQDRRASALGASCFVDRWQLTRSCMAPSRGEEAVEVSSASRARRKARARAGRHDSRSLLLEADTGDGHGPGHLAYTGRGGRLFEGGGGRRQEGGDGRPFARSRRHRRGAAASTAGPRSRSSNIASQLPVPLHATTDPQANLQW